MKILIAGNWKMNKLPSEAVDWAKELGAALESVNTDAEVLIAPPYTHLDGFVKAVGNRVVVAAQDLSKHVFGAYTAEVSAPMLKDLNVDYILVGHSERRMYHNESDESVNAKLKIALEYNLRPILCIGESESEREEGRAQEIVLGQLKAGLAGVEFTDPEELVVAYEPVWAIGTGKTATAEDAEEMSALIRASLKELYPSRADNMRILYGGSMKPANAKELLSKPNINGGLIGGASLKVADFVEIIKQA